MLKRLIDIAVTLVASPVLIPLGLIINFGSLPDLEYRRIPYTKK